MTVRRVYICGALSADAVEYIKNMHKMNAHADEVRRLGVSVFNPCMDIWMGIQCGDWNYEDYFNNSVEWIKVSDAMSVVPGYEKSSGVKRERKVAEQHKIPIFYTIKDLEVFINE